MVGDSQLERKDAPVNTEKLIRFAFASRRRKIMTLCIGGTAAVGSLLGLGGDKAPAPKPAAATTATTAVRVAEVTYANCADVRAAGKAPLHRGDPGYSSKLDRDGDGVACS